MVVVLAPPVKAWPCSKLIWSHSVRLKQSQTSGLPQQKVECKELCNQDPLGKCLAGQCPNPTARQQARNVSVAILAQVFACDFRRDAHFEVSFASFFCESMDFDHIW